MTSHHLSYVLITPARNEAQLIAGTIESVIGQTTLPRKWVIVSDGSTDETDAIVRTYAGAYPWIELVRRPEHQERHFAAKVQSFNTGLQALPDNGYDILGNLDADITFEKDYFEFLLERFAEDERLGVAGTPFVEGEVRYDYRFANIEHVSGACQLFRRECFEDIGGYVAVAGGGIDWIAVTTARMKGWKTRTFLEKVCHHHRPMGTAAAGAFTAWYRLGRKDYCLGGHPLWQLCRTGFQMSRRPYVIGGLLLLAGYMGALARRAARPVSPELVRFHRAEQMSRLRHGWSRLRS
ncbi:MAG TPA: glycosyltransferase family 2 protein [Candidatus Acidoferrum sp.]|nr:glycosyltransferase family 2 protein [Candidatus Acidoferrum sp.]